MAEHTPLPWANKEYASPPDTYFVRGPNNESVLNSIKNGRDAALIVKAVNMHERLVDALKQAALELEEATKLIRGSTIDGTPMVNTAEIFERAAKRTRALLAEAENHDG